MVNCGEGPEPEEQLRALQREIERMKPRNCYGSRNLGIYQTQRTRGLHLWRMCADEAESAGLRNGQEVSRCDGVRDKLYRVEIVG